MRWFTRSVCGCIVLMPKLHRPLNFQGFPPSILADHATNFPVLHQCFQLLWNHATSLLVLDSVYSDFVCAGRGVASSFVKSCGTDVEDVLAGELEGAVGMIILEQRGHVIFRTALYFCSFK